MPKFNKGMLGSFANSGAQSCMQGFYEDQVRCQEAKGARTEPGAAMQFEGLMLTDLVLQEACFSFEISKPFKQRIVETKPSCGMWWRCVGQTPWRRRKTSGRGGH